MPRRSSRSRARVSAARRLRPAITAGSATFSSTVMPSRRLKNWKTMPMWRRRSRARSSSACPVTSSPATKIVPSSATSSPATRLSSVDLPHPEGPISAANWPRGTVRSRPRSARTGAFSASKVLRTPCADSAGDSSVISLPSHSRSCRRPPASPFLSRAEEASEPSRSVPTTPPMLPPTRRSRRRAPAAAGAARGSPCHPPTYIPAALLTREAPPPPRPSTSRDLSRRREDLRTSQRALMSCWRACMAAAAATARSA